MMQKKNWARQENILLRHVSKMRKIISLKKTGKKPLLPLYPQLTAIVGSLSVRST